MIEASIGINLHKLLEDSKLGLLLSNVKVESLSSDFRKFTKENHQNMILNLENQKEGEFQVIQETRKAYKICGKEPSRYRPSAEALMRRLRTKKELYQINNVVDTINLISINTQYSIGGFDYENIDGSIICEIGDSNPYEAIGRGNLNIEFMPGLKDNQGFFGTPTSDSVRTMVNQNTSQLLLVFYDFYGNNKLEDAMKYGENMINTHCKGSTIYKSIISSS